jgi:DNA-binding beta-propeller fold protein YncE
MRHQKLALALLAAAIPTGVALAKVVGDFDIVAPTFEMSGRPVGGTKAASPTAAHLAGSRIAALADGALAIDADSGALIRTDAAGKHVAHVAIGRDAGLLAYDPAAKLAYVADRKADRVAVVSVGKTLELKASWKTPVEPYGVALSPDKKQLLVTTIADRTLVALDTQTGHEAWRAPLAREPRNIAIAPDGTRALVAYLATGTVDQIDLGDRRHATEHIALSSSTPRRARSDGDSFVRGAFTVAFMGEHEAVVPFQRETPVQNIGMSESTGSYGGGFEPPVSHQVAFIGLDGGRTTQMTAQIAQHQPHAIAWDASRDALYIAGLGSDTVLQIKNASAVGIAAGPTANLVQGKDRCGPDGLAIAPDGGVYVWCSFTRSVDRVEFADGDTKVKASVPLVASAMSDKQHEGMILFHAATAQVSQRGSMACATCHPDGRADGLSWRIEKHELQTPILAGRVTGTGPFKWDGTDPDLKASMTSTMKRLGGMGLDPKQTDALGAYLEFMPTVRAPSRDTAAVARGKKLFDSAELGCRSCHDGAHYTDQERHKLSGTLEQVDTPSLHGLAASAPYFHDGSAVTLESLLRDRGAVHGMAATEKLSDQQVADLTAFLETL